MRTAPKSVMFISAISRALNQESQNHHRFSPIHLTLKITAKGISMMAVRKSPKVIFTKKGKL